MRPKSMATVVVVLSGTASASSTPIDSSVIWPSVVAGGISDREPTSGVLPAPKPAAIRTFRPTMCSASSRRRDPRRGRVGSPGTKSIEQPLQDLPAGPAVLVDGDGQGHGQV